MKNYISLVLLFLFIISTKTYAGEKPELSIILPAPWVSGFNILGDYRSSDGVPYFSFDIDGTFTYQLSKKGGLKDGAYKGSSCSLTNRNSGEVLHQGNFMFYFNANSCCYDVKLMGKKLLVLNKIWQKNEYGGFCPTTNLRFIPKR